MPTTPSATHKRTHFFLGKPGMPKRILVLVVWWPSHMQIRRVFFSDKIKYDIYNRYTYLYVCVYFFLLTDKAGRQAAGTTSSHTTRKLNVIIGLDRMESEQRNLSVWWPCRIISVLRISINTYMLFCCCCCCCCFFFLSIFLFIYADTKKNATKWFIKFHDSDLFAIKGVLFAWI